MIIIFFLAPSGEKDTDAEKAKRLLIILRKKNRARALGLFTGNNS